MEYNVRVEEGKREGITFSEMKCGQIGVIVTESYKGWVVQRIEDERIIVIGKEDYFSFKGIPERPHRVRLLQPGDKILL